MRRCTYFLWEKNKIEVVFLNSVKGWQRLSRICIQGPVISNAFSLNGG